MDKKQGGRVVDGLHTVEGITQDIKRSAFDESEISVLRQSISISEDLISDFYKISTSEWKRYRYDIQSLKDLHEEEITDGAFAQIRRYRRCPDERLRGSEVGDFFKICLQDHVIRRATQRDPGIRLFPLSVYIVIHELIHVVRFARFLQRFDSTTAERDAEEKRVHALTFQLLGGCRIGGIAEILDAFRDSRAMETFVGLSE
ncbi:MAG: hypothetical protein ABFD98_11420 [Syntrophobacteraceae bacterium]|nr:hypothetical protein [Desulfobacteraceae bacterium]